MLQQMLGTHPQIYTVSEPWIMLHPLYALREEGIEADYNAEWAHTALNVFLKSLPSGEEDYYEGIRRMYGYLYERALEERKADLFLDKTPRYYKILPELRQVFPQARFLLLFRNPLAVLSSILHIWVGTAWFGIRRYREDLLEAPKKLVAAKDQLGDSVCIIRYEELVSDPVLECRRICRHLGIEFDRGMIMYGKKENERQTFGDPNNVYQKDQPASESVQKWIDRADSPQEWRLLEDYLTMLDRSVLASMGYPYDQLAETVRTHRPDGSFRRFTFSLEWLLKEYPDAVPRWKHELVDQVSNFRQGGIPWVMRQIGRRIIGKITT